MHPDFRVYQNLGVDILLIRAMEDCLLCLKAIFEEKFQDTLDLQRRNIGLHCEHPIFESLKTNFQPSVFETPMSGDWSSNIEV